MKITRILNYCGALAIGLLPSLAALPAAAGLVTQTQVSVLDEVFYSNFLLGNTLDDVRPAGAYTLTSPFNIGGIHWRVTGEIEYTGTTGLTSELLTISGTYVHMTNPHPGETENSYSFSHSWSAWDVATDGMGDPALVGTKFGTMFDEFQLHPGGDHLDRFSATFFLMASNPTDPLGPKLFNSAFFEFTSSHPVPLPAALPCLIAGLGGLAWIRRRQQS